MANTLDLPEVFEGDRLASQIANQWDEWKMRRTQWEKTTEEIRQYIFATDTTQTTNQQLPWKNKTTTPKLTQIRDNLHANYMAALFPSSDWLKWEGDDEAADTQEKTDIITAYMENKTKNSGFRTTISQLVLDYIDYGNAFSMVVYDSQTKTLADGTVVSGYEGPKVERISPYDIVFNVAATNFRSTPKIIRQVKTLGDLQKEIDTRPDLGYNPEILAEILDDRAKFFTLDKTDRSKSVGLKVDGFGNIEDYYGSGYVEILTFYGDMYDINTGELLKDHIITVVDRRRILRKVENPSWLGSDPINHVGWRLRPDNLMAMGPLDNLVGMQYRIDHLENLKADVFDMIAHPMLQITGFVEDFNYGPGERIYATDGKVDFMHPDVTALNADTQIQILENKMEEMAGAPKQAMGFRTPGEKTAFEVQTLDNASGRIFQNKTSYFEEEFIELTLNTMLEVGRRHLQTFENIKIKNKEIGVVEFMQVTPEDITAKGKLRPMGARHFAARAKLIQEINSFIQSPVGQDPAVNVHISGKKLAFLFEDKLDLERFTIVEDNIRLLEQAETQRIGQQLQQSVEQEAEVDLQPTDEELDIEG